MSTRNGDKSGTGGGLRYVTKEAAPTTILLEDFLEHWHWAYQTAVFPNARK
jgi:hypothetical protein